MTTGRLGVTLYRSLLRSSKSLDAEISNQAPRAIMMREITKLRRFMPLNVCSSEVTTITSISVPQLESRNFALCVVSLQEGVIRHVIQIMLRYLMQ